MTQLGDFEYDTAQIAPEHWHVYKKVVDVVSVFVAKVNDEATAKKIARALNDEDGV